MRGDNPLGYWIHWCPACDTTHVINTKSKNSNGACWQGPGDPRSPTFSPSINLTWGHMVPHCGAQEREWYLSHNLGGRCHYFVRQGNIEYCGDSTHGWGGRVVPLPCIAEDGYPQGVSV